MLNFLSDRKLARSSSAISPASTTTDKTRSPQRWTPPLWDLLSSTPMQQLYIAGANHFSVDLILRGHLGNYVTGKVMKVGMKSSVFEVEVVAIYEGLKWVTAFSYQNIKVKSDSLIAVQSS